MRVVQEADKRQATAVEMYILYLFILKRIARFYVLRVAVHIQHSKCCICRFLVSNLFLNVRKK